MSHIVIPSSVTEQGYAFEDLILSHYQKSGRYHVREWSSYLHGKSGKWWQCDGIIENTQGCYLLEAKFFRDRLVTVRDINPSRRQAAAKDLECTGILYIALNDFDSDMRDWKHTKLDVQFLTWEDMRVDVLSSVGHYASALLDEFELTTTQAQTMESKSTLRFETSTAMPLSPRFSEFITVPDALERWLRRMPYFSLQMDQMAAGYLWYNAATEQVDLVSGRASDLSLQEAWAIQDAISGYASRTYNAIRATAEALLKTSDSLIPDIQVALHSMGWKTGTSGIHSSLAFLVLLGLAQKWNDGRRVGYKLTPLGKAYALSGPDDAMFSEILKSWLPYQAVCKAINEHGASPTSEGILHYFKLQYAPYEPYARSLFNPNKSDGLIRLYKQFGG